MLPQCYSGTLSMHTQAMVSGASQAHTMFGRVPASAFGHLRSPCSQGHMYPCGDVWHSLSCAEQMSIWQNTSLFCPGYLVVKNNCLVSQVLWLLLICIFKAFITIETIRIYCNLRVAILSRLWKMPYLPSSNRKQALWLEASYEFRITSYSIAWNQLVQLMYSTYSATFLSYGMHFIGLYFVLHWTWHWNSHYILTSQQDILLPVALLQIKLQTDN